MVLDKRRLVGFVICTFLFTYSAWGLIIAADRFGLFGFNTPVGTLLYICGTWAPTLFSYIILKQNKTIHTMKDFIKLTFSLKAKPKLYVLALIFLVALYIPAMIGNGTNRDIGWFVWLPIFPLMILDGGMEEVGWRYLVQPTLEKRFSFFSATIVTACIWWTWHLPMFFIPGSGQSEMSFLLFALFIFGQSFALAAIFQASKSVWLCIMYHALVNTLSMYWPVGDHLPATLASSVAAIVLSLSVVHLKQAKRHWNGDER
ncbi:CPBP family intramembrane glutamic endopeptidase [Paenibacillus apis]|uniref:CPBP family intramembrane glutamic endopeptidase n=1 Tax=Paenibacillus apis TaxID=1792174 RepID=UPI002657CDDF|nr:CPBP family intramembrane glutamic endopeptidase [Paenibacillus apis]